MSQILVLRLGHRAERDKRVTTHVGLVARAFGASGMLLARKDRQVEESIRKIVELWGGEFYVKSGVSWKEEVEKWKREEKIVVHLTMYGRPLKEVIENLRGRDILVVVGAEKVPGELFRLADVNVAVGNQPHSEIAALAVFLDRLFKGRELEREFPGWKLKILPSVRGKRVLRR